VRSGVGWPSSLTHAVSVPNPCAEAADRARLNVAPERTDYLDFLRHRHTRRVFGAAYIGFVVGTLVVSLMAIRLAFRVIDRRQQRRDLLTRHAQ
jgi:hypothetical protein